MRTVTVLTPCLGGWAASESNAAVRLPPAQGSFRTPVGSSRSAGAGAGGQGQPRWAAAHDPSEPSDCGETESRDGLGVKLRSLVLLHVSCMCLMHMLLRATHLSVGLATDASEGSRPTDIFDLVWTCDVWTCLGRVRVASQRTTTHEYMSRHEY